MTGGLALSLLVSAPVLRATDQCLSCHASSGGLTNSRGKAITVDAAALAASVHKDFRCLDCHGGAAKFPHTAKTASASCLACHADVGTRLASSAHAALPSTSLRDGAVRLSLTVLSVSRRKQGRTVVKPESSATCVTCHGEHNVVKPAARGIQLCAACHEAETKQFAASIHGQARRRGIGEAPSCGDCHGAAHQVVTAGAPNSPVNKLNLPQTCGRCHSNPALAAKFLFAVAKPVEAYESGVHGRAIRAGKMTAAVCNDCHGGHDILPADDPRSPIFKFRVASTCAKCHSQVFAQYKESIHGRAVSSGVEAAPTCTDCHGEHGILAPDDPKSPVYVANISRLTCSHCHADQRLNARFALPAGQVASYENSYHGLAAQAGSQTVANCASCHGVHNILPSSDPRSTIARANLPQTCGKCHPEAGKKFALGPVHVLPASTAESPWLYYVRLFYLFTIPTVVGFMLLHNLLDWLRKMRRHLAQYRMAQTPLRLSLNERVQHALLLASFITLVITGFMLKFPESFWAAPLVRWEKDFPLRGLVHRIAGVVLIGAGFYHLLYLAFSREGRRDLRAMLPKAKDVRDAVQTVGYNLGYRREAPLYPKFNYAEKLEYWALVWGTVVMAVTGILLWGHNFVLEYFPKLVIDVATAIHFYEAILATLAIVIWHFYAVIFDPDVYPLKWTFVSGRAPEHEVREEAGSAELSPDFAAPGVASQQVARTSGLPALRQARGAGEPAAAGASTAARTPAESEAAPADDSPPPNKPAA
jgi:formate dehydrogenase gamma subunit